MGAQSSLAGLHAAAPAGCCVLLLLKDVEDGLHSLSDVALVAVSHAFSSWCHTGCNMPCILLLSGLLHYATCSLHCVALCN